MLFKEKLHRLAPVQAEAWLEFQFCGDVLCALAGTDRSYPQGRLIARQGWETRLSWKRPLTLIVSADRLARCSSLGHVTLLGTEFSPNLSTSLEAREQTFVSKSSPLAAVAPMAGDGTPGYRGPCGREGWRAGEGRPPTEPRGCSLHTAALRDRRSMRASQ